MSGRRLPLVLVRLAQQWPSAAPRTWRSRLPWPVLRFLNRLQGPRPLPIAQMARDYQLEEEIVSRALIDGAGINRLEVAVKEWRTMSREEPAGAAAHHPRRQT